ncbi:MAG: hypothetical protein E7Y34_00875 [Mycoplasma sp.]|nr:hypothetical protein [Mycoplasma sp.]
MVNNKINNKRLIRLTKNERRLIKEQLAKGYSIRWIAKLLKRSFETIRREIVNNGGKQNYNDLIAHQKALQNRIKTRVNSTHLLHQDLIDYIKKNYVPGVKSFILILKDWKNINPNIKTPCIKTIFRPL